MRFAFKAPDEIRNSTHFVKFETTCRQVEQKINEVNTFGIENLNITFFYNGQFDIFYKSTPSIFIHWNNFSEKSSTEIAVSLAHEVGHHVIEQQETFRLFRTYIESQYGTEAVKILTETYLDNYSRSIFNDEIVADFLATRVWGLPLLDISNADIRIRSVDVLEKELNTGDINTYGRAARY